MDQMKDAMTEVDKLPDEPSQAYKDYMALAERTAFRHAREGTMPSPDEIEEARTDGQVLWDAMSGDEQWQAEDTVLRTVIHLDACRKLEEKP